MSWYFCLVCGHSNSELFPCLLAGSEVDEAHSMTQEAPSWSVYICTGLSVRAILNTCPCECCFDAYFIFLQKNMIHLFKCLKCSWHSTAMGGQYSGLNFFSLMQKKSFCKGQKAPRFPLYCLCAPQFCNSYCNVWNEVTPSRNHPPGDRERCRSLVRTLWFAVWFFVSVTVTWLLLINSAGVRDRRDAEKHEVPHSLTSSSLDISSISPRTLRKLLSPITPVWGNSLNLLWAASKEGLMWVLR